MRRFVLLAAVLCLVSSDVSAAAKGTPLQPAIELESAAGVTRVWVELDGPDGRPQRRLLRETEAQAVVRKSGSDPLGRAAFATWDEDGRRWFSYSRDGGASWAASRLLETDLRLRDGAVLPGTSMPVAPPELTLSATGRLFIVQFRTTGLPEWRDTLRGLGIEVLGHIPHNAHIVRTDGLALDEIRAFEFVERVEPYHPWYRLGPELRQQIAGADQASFGLERVRAVMLEWGPVAKERVIATLLAAGAQVAEYWPSGHVVELWVDLEQLHVLAAHDDVQWVDRWTPSGPDMDLVREDAGTNRVETLFGYCGQGVRGEVMDGGIEDTHPDFDGILLHGPTGLDSHGTATYGIVFGNGDRDGDGDGQGTGNMPCAQGIFAAYPNLVDRFVHTQELKQAPYFASFQTNSWGGGLTTAYTSTSQEMDDIIWQLDIAITQSQSNNGNRSSRPQAWAKNVISVGGIRHYDTLDTSDDAWASGASIGPAADGRIKPDVSYWYDDIFTTTTGGGYRTDFGGTSAATPESAGVLGLIVQMWAENVWETDPAGTTVFEKQPHASTIKALLINNAQQYDFVGSGSDLDRFRQGWGRPSALVAQQRALTSLVVDEEEILALDDKVNYSVAVPTGESELKVTMIYPDPPGTITSTLHRINNVNLRVTSPSATVYHGNAGLEDGTESTSGGSPDDLNTVENVFVKNPQPGIWDVEVEAVEINQDAHLPTPADDVTFALVVTGAAPVYTSGAGQLRLTPTENACDATYQILVRDGNVGSSTLNVEVSSDTETTPETTALQEISTGSGQYAGAITSTSGIPANGDGMISVADGDTVTVEYIDADDGAGGTSLSLQQTATTDCAAPTISQVIAIDITNTEARLTWTTDEDSSSSAIYGNLVPPGQPAANSGAGTSHSVLLKGLTDCTTYYYAVASEDRVGNASSDDNGGSFYLFTTLTETDGQLHSCREGTLVIEADAVTCAGAVPVRLTDTDLNLDPQVAEAVPVFLSSSTETEPEIVTLIETGPDTGEFTGSLPTGAGLAAAADGILQTTHGDLVTGRHEDADDGTGNPATNTYTVDADCEGPQIQAVTVSGISNAAASVSWTTPESTTGYVEWGTTPALGTQVDSFGTLSHSADLGVLPECGRVYFRVVGFDVYGNMSVAESEGTPFEFNAYGVPGVFYEDGFETDTGWTLEGEWQIGAPLGLGSAPGDPTQAFAGAQVLGHDLSGLGANLGDYEPDSSEVATSPVIDASGLVNGELQIQRWLNVFTGTFAYLDVKDSGGSWHNVYTSPTTGGFTESSWTTQSYDVSQWADGNPSFQVRFRNTSHISASFDAGWNVDQLVLRDGTLPPFEACGGCGGTPTFGGLISAADNDPCADSDVTLQWQPAPAWGTGTSGTYAVYRDTSPGFTPGPGNLVASGLAVTTWTDATAPNDVTHYYAVRAENDETCGSGPNNAGAQETNLVYAMAQDATGQTLPGMVDTLLVGQVNRAHTRLSWPITPDAATYHVYRADSPDTPFGLHATTGETSYEDAEGYGDGMDRYYLVVAADACGNEGP